MLKYRKAVIKKYQKHQLKEKRYHRQQQQQQQEDSLNIKHKRRYAPGKNYYVRPGDVLNDRYCIKKKLGTGHFSLVWLAYDQLKNKYVAVKIVKSSRSYAEAGLDERKLALRLQNSSSRNKDFVLKMLDFFYVPSRQRPNERHYCLVFELMWKELFHLVRMSDHNGLRTEWLRVCAYQILRGMCHLHERGLIHTDVKPENVMISPIVPIAQARYFKVKISDLGNACHMSKHTNDEIQTRQYRAPEVIMGCEYSTSADMFSVGIMLMELATGDLIFNPRGPKFNTAAQRSQYHLALMMRTLGGVPRYMLRHGNKASLLFDHTDKLRDRAVLPSLQSCSLEQHIRRNHVPVDHKFVDLLRGLLDMHPERRLTAREALEHPWFKKIHHQYTIKGAEVAFAFSDGLNASNLSWS